MIEKSYGIGVNVCFLWDVVGKIGIINDVKDVWFVGYIDDVVVFIYVGFDNVNFM